MSQFWKKHVECKPDRNRPADLTWNRKPDLESKRHKEFLSLEADVKLLCSGVTFVLFFVSFSSFLLLSSNARPFVQSFLDVHASGIHNCLCPLFKEKKCFVYFFVAWEASLYPSILYRCL